MTVSAVAAVLVSVGLFLVHFLMQRLGVESSIANYHDEMLQVAFMTWVCGLHDQKRLFSAGIFPEPIVTGVTTGWWIFMIVAMFVAFLILRLEVLIFWPR
jgi:hypothetical protein